MTRKLLSKDIKESGLKNWFITEMRTFSGLYECDFYEVLISLPRFIREPVRLKDKNHLIYTFIDHLLINLKENEVADFNQVSKLAMIQKTKQKSAVKIYNAYKYYSYISIQHQIIPSELASKKPKIVLLYRKLVIR